MNAFRVPVEEQELFIDVFKAVLVVVDRPFGITIVFLAVGAAVVIDVAFKACAFVVTLVPFAAKGTALHAASTIALFVELVVDDHKIHFLILDLLVDIHQNDVRFNIIGAFAGQVHIFVSLQQSLLHVNIDGVGNFTFLDFIEHLLGRHKDHLVALLNSISQLVSHIVQALLHVNMHRIGTTRHKVHANAHIPFTCSTTGILVNFAEGIFADTVNKNHFCIQLGHHRFFFIKGATQTPKIRIQAEHFGKGLIAIKRREQRVVAGILFFQKFGILRYNGHIAKTVTLGGFRHRLCKRHRQKAN